MKNFKDKVAVVTGAASGIGKGMARRFAKEGMKVVMADVEKEALANAEAELKKDGGQVSSVLCDVSDPKQVEGLAKHSRETHGAVDILCNNAGVSSAGLLWDTPLDEWKWVMGVNLWGVIHGIRYFVPDMIKQGTEGHIVNTSSVLGMVVGPFLGVYQTTKHAVLGVSETLHHELNMMQSKIKVSVLCPAAVNTKIAEAGRNRPASLGGGSQAAGLMAGAGANMLAKGMSPEKIADQVFDAIQNEKLFILTHPDMDEAIRTRWDNVVNRKNPTGLGGIGKAFTGMP